MTLLLQVMPTLRFYRTTRMKQKLQTFVSQLEPYQ